MNIAVFPATFDPVTLGHMDLIVRAAKLYDQLVVAVSTKIGKSPLFAHAKRVEMVQLACQPYTNVQVQGYEGLLVDFMKHVGSDVVIRGIRDATDYGLEAQMSQMNRALAPEIETLLLVARPEYIAISATLVREIIVNQGDYAQFVPKAIVPLLS